MDETHPLGGGVAGLYRALWRYASGCRLRLVAAMLLLIGAELIRLAAPWLAGEAINTIQREGRAGTMAAGRDLALIVASLAAGWTLHGPGRILERNVALHARTAYADVLLQRLLQAPLAWHRAHHSAETAHRVTQSSQALHDFAENQYVYLQNTVVLIGPLVALWLIAPVIGAVAAAGFALLSALSLLYDRVLIRLSDRRNAADRGYAVAWVDTLANLSTIYALRRFAGVRRLIADRRDQLYAPLRHIVWLNEAKWATVDIVGTLVSCGLVALYAVLALRRAGSAGTGLALGSLYMVYAYSQRAEAVMSTIAADFSMLAGQQANFISARPIFHTPQLDPVGATAATAWHRLALDRVVYRPDGAPLPVLDAVTLSLARGRTYALIGDSGAGKSSLLRVLAGLEPVTGGTIRRDGEAIAASVLRREATLMPQEAQLFVGTVAENLTLGAVVPASELHAALELAQADTFIDALPGGIATVVEEGGANWSGGQRQRLALARGLLAASGSSLVLLDEPTSSLDAATGARVLDALLGALAGSTVVVALHRLDLLDRFDYVLRVADGRVVDGAAVETHAEHREAVDEVLAAR